MDLIDRQQAIDGADAIIAMDTSGNNDVVKAMTAWKSYVEALPSAQPEQCDDAVSRHRLLNDLEELTTAWEKYPVMAEQIKGVEVAIGYVKSIPSVQPETHEERTETHACDCISREAAIDAVSRGCQEFRGIFAECEKNLNALPSAQPTQPNASNALKTLDCIDRQAAIELKPEFLNPNVNRETEEQTAIDRAYARGWNSCNTHWIDEISELPSAQPDAPDTNGGDIIYRQAAIDAICAVCGNDCDKSEFVYNAPQDEQVILCPEHYCLCTLPSAQPEPLSDAYTKAVLTWLLDYQIKAAKLKGRYTPYEVLSWVVNDWRKEHEGSD